MDERRQFVRPVQIRRARLPAERRGEPAGNSHRAPPPRGAGQARHSAAPPARDRHRAGTTRPPPPHPPIAPNTAVTSPAVV
jgi:hypothetical protein